MVRSIPPDLALVAPAARRHDAATAAECAADVLDVMPLVMDAMRAAMRHHVGDQLSVPQFRCLNFLVDRPGSSVSAVAAFLGITLPTASAMLDRLQKAGALAPRTATADRRRSELHVTPAGLAQIQHIRRDALVEFAATLQACSSDELHTLQAGLTVLRRAFLPSR